MRIVVVMLTLLLSACSSMPGPSSRPAPRFMTHITDEGSKRFVFEALAMDQLPSAGIRAPSSRRQAGRVDLNTSLDEEQVQGWLADKHYCQQGFIMLSRTPWKIRGECNETATAQDRQRFPNSPTWVE